MSDPLIVLGRLDDPALKPTTYYRMEVPLRALEQAGVARTSIAEREDDPVAKTTAMLHSDVTLFYGVTGEAVLDTIEKLHALPLRRRMDDSPLYPPSVVVDWDDDISRVAPMNPAYATMGTRDWHGEPLRRGATLSVTPPAGEPLTLWEDGITAGVEGIVFDVERNQAMLARAHAIAREADGVTVTTEPLARVFREEVGCANVHVFPNTVLPEDYPQIEVVRRQPGTVRILWQGGNSHVEDLWALGPALGEVVRAHPHVVVVLWGCATLALADHIPPAQMEVVPAVPYAGYRPWRVLVDADINLCPLVDSAFNDCKSAIKWYEGSVLHRPEATLAARVGPYAREIRDGETGLLYDDMPHFTTQLQTLIDDAVLRRRLGDAAKAWVTTYRSPAATAPDLAAFYHDLRAQRRRGYLTVA